MSIPASHNKGNFITRAFRAIFNLGVTDEKAWNRSLWNLLGGQSHAGVNVTEETALTYSAVWNAINLYAGSISTMPLHLMLKSGTQKRQVTESRTYQLLHTKFNQYMTAQIGREVLTAHALSWGNGFAEKVFTRGGELAELWPIPPNRVNPVMENGEILYEIDVEVGTKVTLPRERVLHIPGLGFDGFVGYSVVGMARESIGLGMALEQFGSNFFRNGTHPGVIVSHPGVLTPEASQNLQKNLQDQYGGLGNTHKLLLLEEAMKLEKVGIPPEDAQFLQSRQFQIPEIARWFNLPPHKLKDLTKSSFNNIEQEQISFVTDSILPWVVRFETNFNLQLLTAAQQRKGYYFKHSVEGLLRGDSASRAEFYTKMFNIGAMNINEIRGKEDMDPIENGDRHFVPLNMAALDKFDEVQANADKQTKPVEEPSEPSEQREQIENQRANLIPLR